jgi:hypothetical protein
MSSGSEEEEVKQQSEASEECDGADSEEQQ